MKKERRNSNSRWMAMYDEERWYALYNRVLMLFILNFREVWGVRAEEG
jgi:hypothetical protein